MPKTSPKGRPVAPKDIFASDEAKRELESFRIDLQLDDNDNIWTCDEQQVPDLRHKLDDGRLTRVLESYQKKIEDKVKPDEEGRQPWRTVRVLLGLCAIRLGSKLPDGFIRFMKDNRHTCKLFDNSVKNQIRDACDSYQEGSFYEFATVTPPSAGAKTKKVNLQTPATTIAPAPVENAKDDEVPQEESLDEKNITPKIEDEASTTEHEPEAKKKRVSPRSHARPSLEPQGAPTPSDITAEGCAVCESRGYVDGCPLLVCGACKDVIYCSAECQRKHWKNGHSQDCFGYAAFKVSRVRSNATTPTPAINGVKRKATPIKQNQRASKRTRANKWS